ncbi:hypothetical protein NEISICOT_03698, partial [Neisseria sicca ATCC 29256]
RFRRPLVCADSQPPSGGCVLKRFKESAYNPDFPSRLRAAVC